MIVFYVNFDDWRLATMAFVSLSLYGYVTVRVTLWRKKFRQATNKHDNDYHDKATDRYILYCTRPVLDTCRREGNLISGSSGRMPCLAGGAFVRV